MPVLSKPEAQFSLQKRGPMKESQQAQECQKAAGPSIRICQAIEKVNPLYTECIFLDLFFQLVDH